MIVYRFNWLKRYAAKTLQQHQWGQDALHDPIFLTCTYVVQSDNHFLILILWIPCVSTIGLKVMTYSLLKLAHIIGSVLIVAGLTGVWLSDLRSRQSRELPWLAAMVFQFAFEFIEGNTITHYSLPASISYVFPFDPRGFIGWCIYARIRESSSRKYANIHSCSWFNEAILNHHPGHAKTNYLEHHVLHRLLNCHSHGHRSDGIDSSSLSVCYKTINNDERW